MWGYQYPQWRALEMLPFRRIRGIACLAALLLVASSCLPSDRRPGLRIGGTPTEAPGSWSQVDDHDEILIETRTLYPWVVSAWYAGTDRGLYVLGISDAHWFQRARNHPDVRIRMGEATCEATATLIEDRNEIEFALQALHEKYAELLEETGAEFSYAELDGEVMSTENTLDKLPYGLLRMDRRLNQSRPGG